MSSRSRQRNKHKKQGFAIPKKMLPIIAGGVFLAVVGIALLAILGGGNSAAGEPDLVVEQDFYDYGEVAFNTPIETVFTIRNEGTAPLKIQGTPQVVLKDGC